MKKILLVALCIAFALTMLVGCGKEAAGESESSGTAGEFDQYITFGVNYELTGANPIIGESAKKGIDMAVNEINAAGGITVDGKVYGLKYKALDNGFNTDEAAVNAQQFADDPEIC
ncbi:MAG: ABC transporter substrate-binding protein, partial [Bacillota bacterium]